MQPSPTTQLRSMSVLDFGLFRVHAGRTIGIPGYLLQTQAGRNILVDTGFPAAYSDDPQRASIEDGLGVFGELLGYGAHQSAPAQLALLGLAPADIDTLILTHTHIDHIGGLPQFTHCRVILHAVERALPQPLYFNDRSRFDWPAVREWQLVDSDCAVLPGVQLLYTPGHSPGHQSLLLQLPETGAVLLTGDAIDRPALFVEGFGNATAHASAERLLRTAKEHDALVIYGHDPAQWPTLRKAPLAYL
jgi:N-acyl homoserine lactone hydrolase